MRSPPWTLLAAAPFFFALLRTIATTEPQNNTNVDDDGRQEFEDNVLRAWIEQLIEKYNENVQSSTRSTHIQRIAKKGRTSASPAGTRGRFAPPPADSVLFNPYYRPSFYSGYVPFPYGPPTTTHLIPIGHVSYPQRGYHRRLFIPVHAQQFPYVPEITSPALVPGGGDGGGDYSNAENRPADVQQTQYVIVPQNGPQDDDEPHGLETTADGDLDQGVEGERPKPTRGGKLLQDGVNDNVRPAISTLTTAPTAPTTSTTTTTTTMTTTMTTSAPESDDRTTVHPGHDEAYFTSVSPSQTYSSVPQLPSSEDYYRSAEESRTISPASSAAAVTEQPSTVSPERLETTTTKSATETSTWTAESDGGPREAQDHRATPMTTTTTTEDPQTTADEATTRTPVETTTVFAVYATSAARSAAVSVSIPSSESIYSTARSTIGPTTDSRPSTSLSSAAAISDTTTTRSSNVETTSTVTRESRTGSVFKVILDENNGTKPTGSNDTLASAVPAGPQTFDNTAAVPVPTTEADAASTPLIAKNDQNERKYVGLKDASVSRSTAEWTTISNLMARHESVAEIARINSSPSADTPPTSHVIQLQTNTESKKTYNADSETNGNYRPPTTTSSSSSSSKSTVPPPITPRNRGDPYDPRKPSFTTISGDSSPYAISTTSGQDQYTTITSQTSQNYKGSDLWYDHLPTRNVAKQELNEEQIDYLLKKLTKLLKPEIEKQSITKESIARFITPKHGDQEKLIYIILPWIRDATKNKGNEKQTEINTDPLKTSNKM